ncbi:MAG: hypothetical protein CBC05_08375 [Crocinitomicaceae bacterium TMED45]|nr:MAG: hypothetical protein CBC05_08375 [Crocinitomicaceae bacterium TMED45]
MTVKITQYQKSLNLYQVLLTMKKQELLTLVMLMDQEQAMEYCFGDIKKTKGQILFGGLFILIIKAKHSFFGQVPNGL